MAQEQRKAGRSSRGWSQAAVGSRRSVVRGLRRQRAVAWLARRLGPLALVLAIAHAHGCGSAQPPDRPAEHPKEPATAASAGATAVAPAVAAPTVADAGSPVGAELLATCVDSATAYLARTLADVPSRLKPGLTAALDLVERCQSGSADACRRSATDDNAWMSPFPPPREDCERVALLTACEGGDALGCALAAANGAGARPELARSQASSSCAAGNDLGCWVKEALDPAATATMPACSSPGCRKDALLLGSVADATLAPRVRPLLEMLSADDPQSFVALASLESRIDTPPAAVTASFDRLCAGTGRRRCESLLGDNSGRLGRAPTHAMAALCHDGDAVQCLRVGLLADAEAGTRERLDPPADFWTRACRAGEPAACSLLGPEAVAAAGLRMRSCAQEPDRCGRFLEATLVPARTWLPYMVALGISYQPERVELLGRAACDRGRLASCRLLVEHGAVTDPQEQLSLLRKSCPPRSPDARGCELLARELDRSAPASAETRQALERACELGGARSCRTLGLALLGSASDPRTAPTRAIMLLDKSCAGDDIDGCEKLADLYSKADPPRAARYRGRVDDLRAEKD